MKDDQSSNTKAGNVKVKMDGQSLKLYLQNVEEYVMDEDKIVS